MSSYTPRSQRENSMSSFAPLEMEDNDWNAALKAVNENYDINQYMNFDAYDDEGNVVLDTDTVPQSTQLALPETSTESTPFNPELTPTDTQPAVSEAVSSPMAELNSLDAAEISPFDETVFNDLDIDIGDMVLPTDFPSDAEQPDSGYVNPVPHRPFPVSWNPEKGMQQPRPISSSHRPTSAPPGPGYSESKRFRPTSAPPGHGEYDGFSKPARHDYAERQRYEYPDPSNGLFDQDDMQWNNPPGSYPQIPIANMGQPIYPSHHARRHQQLRYQQTSLSCPGSPTQVLDPALMMNNPWQGPPRMPRQIRQYHREAPQAKPRQMRQYQQPSDTYNPASMFGNYPGYSNHHNHHPGYAHDLTFPPTSYPRKRAFSSPSSPPSRTTRKTKKPRVRAAIPTYNSLYESEPDTPTSNPLRVLLRPLTPTSTSDSSPAHARLDPYVAGSTGAVDLSKAVTLSTRRNKNPGRKNTIEQTAAVVKRNLERRKRYRDQLPPQKRAAYDHNAAIAKGLVVFEADGEEGEGSDGYEE